MATFFATQVWGLVDLDLYVKAKVPAGQSARRIVVRNNIAYVASSTNGLQIYGVTNASSPVWLGSYTNRYPATSTNKYPALDVAIGNNGTKDYAFVAIGDGGVDVINISNPSNPFFVTNISDDVVIFSANAVLVQPNAGNNLYIADDAFGVEVIRVTNPAGTGLGTINPDTVNTAFTYGTAVDMVINPANFNFLYVADLESGVTSVNLTTYDAPKNASLDADVYGIASSANGATIFAAMDDMGMQTVDTTGIDWLPKKLYPINGFARGVTFANNRAYVACEDGRIVIVDVSTATQTRIGAYYTGPTQPMYNSTISGDSLFVASGGMLVLGTNLLANPQTFGTYTNMDEFGDTQDIYAVAVFGTNALVSDNNFGLQIVNVGNPANPRRLTGTVDYDVAGTPFAMTVVSNFAYLAEGFSGLEILNLTTLTNLETAFLLPMPNNAHARGIVVTNGYAYIACSTAGVSVVNVSDPYLASFKSALNTGGNANALAYSTNGLVYVADGTHGLTIVNVSNPNLLVNVGNVSTGGEAMDVALSGNYAFVANGANGLTVVNIANPANPIVVTNMNIGEIVSGIRISGDYAYLACGLAGLRVVDISKPANPRRVGANSSFDAVYGLRIVSNRIYVAAGTDGMPILDIYRPIKFQSAPKLITNTMHVFVTGPTNGQAVRIQRSTNLASATSWSDWRTLTFPNTNVFELVDTNYPANLRQYYRGIAP